MLTKNNIETLIHEHTTFDNGVYFTINEKNYCPFCGAPMKIETPSFHQICSQKCEMSIKTEKILVNAKTIMKEARQLIDDVEEEVCENVKYHFAKKYRNEVFPRIVQDTINDLNLILESGGMGNERFEIVKKQ